MDWAAHRESDCQVRRKSTNCTLYIRSVTTSKVVSMVEVKTARPQSTQEDHLVRHHTYASKVAPKQFLPPDDPEPTLYHNNTTEPLCPVCTKLLDRPIQLVCGTIICLECCRRWIQYHHPPLSCPCCYEKLDTGHIKPPPPLVVSLVEGLLVICVRGCRKILTLGQYQQHLKGACTTS